MINKPILVNEFEGNIPAPSPIGFGFDHITELTFSISNKNIKECYQELEKRGFTKVDGDIRVNGGKTFVALGYKKESKLPITDILGVFSDKNQEYSSIVVNGVKYVMIKDFNDNGDINRGAKGKYLYLYYTNAPTAGQPIKDLIFSSLKKKIISERAIVQNAPHSLSKGDLDINSFRGGSYNYIFIIR